MYYDVDMGITVQQNAVHSIASLCAHTYLVEQDRNDEVIEGKALREMLVVKVKEQEG